MAVLIGDERYEEQAYDDGTDDLIWQEWYERYAPTPDVLHQKEAGHVTSRTSRYVNDPEKDRLADMAGIPR